MRVHDSNLNSVTIGTHSSGRAEAGGRAGSSGVSGAGDQDQFSISGLASLLRAASGDSPERAQRVSKLAALFRSGSYSANAAAVSSNIVNDALHAA